MFDELRVIRAFRNPLLVPLYRGGWGILLLHETSLPRAWSGHTRKLSCTALALAHLHQTAFAPAYLSSADR